MPGILPILGENHRNDNRLPSAAPATTATLTKHLVKLKAQHFPELSSELSTMRLTQRGGGLHVYNPLSNTLLLTQGWASYGPWTKSGLVFIWPTSWECVCVFTILNSCKHIIHDKNDEKFKFYFAEIRFYQNTAIYPLSLAAFQEQRQC